MIKVSARYLKAASICMSHEEVRYYLNGVYIEPCAAGGVTLTATDGHRLVCIHDKDGVCDKPTIVAIPRGALVARWLQGEVTIGEDGLFRHETFISLKSAVIDGKYPNFREVVKQAQGDGFVPGAFAAFNASYIGDYGKVAALLTEEKDMPPSSIRLIGGRTEYDPGLIVFPNFPNAFGIVMPMRAKENPAKFEWFNAGVAKAKQKPQRKKAA